MVWTATPPANPAGPDVHGVEQFLSDARSLHHRRHQDEHRHRDQHVFAHEAVDAAGDHDRQRIWPEQRERESAATSPVTKAKGSPMPSSSIVIMPPNSGPDAHTIVSGSRGVAGADARCATASAPSSARRRAPARIFRNAGIGTSQARPLVSINLHGRDRDLQRAEQKQRQKDGSQAVADVVERGAPARRTGLVEIETPSGYARAAGRRAGRRR